jgi:hypothetical protein
MAYTVNASQINIANKKYLHVRHANVTIHDFLRIMQINHSHLCHAPSSLPPLVNSNSLFFIYSFKKHKILHKEWREVA